MRSSLALLPLLLAACATTSTAPQAARPAAELYARSFGTARPVTLLVVLHGDAPATNPGYQYDFAQALAARIPNSRVVALLRPGYEDPQGNRSPGERGLTTGDNYTPDRLDAVSDSLRRLRARYPRARLVLIGHSGGAAMAADLAGTRPELVDGLLLAACPCSLPEWRQHMKARLPAAPFDQPVHSLDPLQTVGGAQLDLRAALVVGADDPITPPRFSRAYAEALALRGIATDYRVIPGKGHEILDDPEVLSAAERLAAALPKKG
ncbi:MAG: alpha/beta fold hydrolase [Sphingomonas sp.]|uniref:alpha/beta hydrolase n=1 Tax=Sphingomonas sp. TaxID=28214 RepID=UPI0022761211|nr:alpha/beta fold hydrolase [Sphingomonas sp.]MCX8477941.1 alpha/beta fold hydrolase [Sphingomonas sp.]